jgi:hypothetical protein
VTQDWARPVVAWDIRATDPDLIRSFYSELFNWEIGDGPIMKVATGIGGPEPGPGGYILKTEQSGVSLYVQVLDLRASLDKAVALGGAVTLEPLDVPGGPTIAGIIDPEGNPVVLVQQ